MARRVCGDEVWVPVVLTDEEREVEQAFKEAAYQEELWEAIAAADAQAREEEEARRDAEDGYGYRSCRCQDCGGVLNPR